MHHKATLQQSLFDQMQDQRLFAQVQGYAQAYLQEVWQRNVYPNEEALADLAHFREPLADGATDPAQVLAMLDQYGSPATVAQLGGRYFGFVNGSVIPVGLAAKHLATYWDQNTAMQVISPISACLEEVVEDWLRQLFNFPERVVAGFVSGTSSANLCALAAARFRLLDRQGWNIQEQGLGQAPPLRIVTGDQAHSSVLKALSILGFGWQQIERVPTDEQGRLQADHLPDLDDRTLVILQAGNVNSGSFDPFEEVCQRARAANAWVHIDGAFGLWAGATKQLRDLTNGMELANSWAVDGHKTLNTPYDSGIVMCDDQEAIVSALHMSGSYLMLGDQRNGMFYTPEMSRRARIIELWAILKYLGREGVDELVSGLHQRARQFAELFAEADGFRVLNEVVFNQVVICCATDELTEKTLRRVQALRECWAGGSEWAGRKVIRISVCSWATTEEDVQRSVASFKQALTEVHGFNVSAKK